MSSILMFFGTLLALSLTWSLIGLTLRRRYHGAPPVYVSAPFLAAVVVISGVLLVYMLRTIAQRLGSLYVIPCLPAGLLLLSFPVWLAARLFLGRVADLFVKGLYGGSAQQGLPFNYGKAHACLQREDIDGAVREFRRYYDENPKISAPLFAAAQLLTERSRPNEAASFYRDIMVRFAKDDEIWAEAAYRLADLLENELHEPQSADSLFRAVLKRARTSEPGRLAAQRLMRNFRPHVDP